MFGYYLRLAWLNTRQSPGLAILVALTIGVGLIASMSTLAMRHVLAGDPIPGKSTRLLNLQDPAKASNGGNWFSYAQAVSLQRLGGTLADAVISGDALVTQVATQSMKAELTGGLGIRYTSANFFRVFNVPLEAGRIWSPQEQAAGTPVAVIQDGLAYFLYPDDKSIGKQIRIGTTIYTVVGVTKTWNPQPRYYNLNGPAGAFGGGGDAIFLPYTTIPYAPAQAMIPQVCQGNGSGPPALDPTKMATSACRWLSMWYLVHTRTDVTKLAQRLRTQLPQVVPTMRATKLKLLDVRQILARANLVPAPLKTYVLLGIAFLVLCVINAAGVQLSRAMRGTPSIGIRRALGARRADIVWQYLCESLLVGGLGGALGIGLTYVVLDVVRHISVWDIPYAQMAHVDGWMLAVMALVALTSSVLAGLVPAMIASHADPAMVIKGVE